jgi:hypothetical protein
MAGSLPDCEAWIYICRHSIEENWYWYKDEAYKEIALEWCRDNCITWCE